MILVSVIEAVDDYLKITGELDVDLRSNIAAEARAKIVYERLINFCDDPGSQDALQFLMTREITHMKAFMAALDSMGKDPLEIGEIPPTEGLVDMYFNESTGAVSNAISIHLQIHWLNRYIVQ
jgi:Mn-containing catalase